MYTPSDLVDVIVLAGGYGARLGGIGEKTSKPLLRLDDRTLLDHIIGRLLEAEAVGRIYLVINTKFQDQYIRWLDSRPELAMVELINNESSGARPGRIDVLTNICTTIHGSGIQRDLLIVGGDNYFTFQVDQFVMFARRMGNICTPVFDVGSIERAKRLTSVVLDSKSKISQLQEKSQEPPSTIVTTCIYWFPANTLQRLDEYIQDHTAETMGMFMEWLLPKETIFGYKIVAPWYDIGTAESYRELLEYLGIAEKPQLYT